MLPREAMLRISSCTFLARSKPRSVEIETEFERSPDIDRLTILNRRLETNLLCGLNRFLGQSIGKATNNTNVFDAPINSEDDAQHHRSLDFILTSLFCVFRLLLINDLRSEAGGHRLYAAAATETHI